MEYVNRLSGRGRICRLQDEISGDKSLEKPNSCANNLNSFTGLPAGYRDPSGFVNIGRHGGWWSADENNEDRGWFYILNYNNSNVYHLYMFKKNDISVRCVKD